MHTVTHYLTSGLVREQKQFFVSSINSIIQTLQRKLPEHQDLVFSAHYFGKNFVHFAALVEEVSDLPDSPRKDRTVDDGTWIPNET